MVAQSIHKVLCEHQTGDLDFTVCAFYSNGSRKMTAVDLHLYAVQYSQIFLWKVTPNYLGKIRLFTDFLI